MSSRIHYLPKLDSLRAIAALMVMGTHFASEMIGPYFRFGGSGVDIFFVLSGYLITGILLAQKDSVELSWTKIYFHFIAKRALRLFPVYYLYLFMLIILSALTGVWLTAPGQMVYYFTYTQNLLMIKSGFSSGLLNHTWSLAVEEQFYLFWPIVILLLPRRTELVFLLLVVLGGFASRIYFTHFFHVPGTTIGLTTNHFTTLGAGGLLAWLVHHKKMRVLHFLGKAKTWLFLVSLSVIVFLSSVDYNDAVLKPFALIVLSVSLIVSCTFSEIRIVDPILKMPALQLIGKFSYGLYLYHKFVLFSIVLLYQHYATHTLWTITLAGIVFVLIGIGTAYLSWRLFERPILKFKDRFDL